jgi:uncharacterized protein YndB with AHSA1/START domain
MSIPVTFLKKIVFYHPIYNMAIIITVTASIKASPEKVWIYWTGREHIMQWNNASPDWHTPRAENDLREGGNFSYNMAAKDGSFGFDFWGTYTLIRPLELIAYTTGDGRKVEVIFAADGDGTTVTERFEAETHNSPELQEQGWQAILDNFKRYAESLES